MRDDPADAMHRERTVRRITRCAKDTRQTSACGCCGHLLLSRAKLGQFVIQFAEPGTVNFTVTVCPGKTLWLASTKSILTLCSPGGSPAMSTVPRSLASAHNQG